MISTTKETNKANEMRSQRKGTKYIYLDKSKCEACWDCINECKFKVLDKVDFWFHKHVKLKNPEKCRGCKSCVEICNNDVFKPVINPDYELSKSEIPN
jgi:ferredoxin